MNTSPLPLQRSDLQPEQILLFVVLLWMAALSLAGLRFPLADFVIILLMGLVIFVPFGLFARGSRR